MSSLVIRMAQPGFRPMLEGLSAPLNFGAMSQITTTNTTIYTQVATTAEFNLHSYITYFDSKFWVMWSTGASNEDLDGQRVVYSTSTDGTTWSAPGTLSGAPGSGFRYIARGFWIRNGVLLALASRDEDDEGYFGASLELRSFAWSGSAWGTQQLVADNCINNFPPVQAPDGDWLMTRRGSDNIISFIKGDIGAWDVISVSAPGGVALSEPDWATINDGLLTCTFRNDDPANVLYRAFSRDSGGTWSTPARTNFPDATSKNRLLKLSDGRFVLANNSNQAVGDLGTGNRNPLTLAVSDDGHVFNRMGILRAQATSPAFPGGSKVSGYMYPDMMERSGYLYIVYSRNKEAIQISKVSIAALP